MKLQSIGQNYQQKVGFEGINRSLVDEAAQRMKAGRVYNGVDTFIKNYLAKQAIANDPNYDLLLMPLLTKQNALSELKVYVVPAKDIKPNSQKIFCCSIKGDSFVASSRTTFNNYMQGAVSRVISGVRAQLHSLPNS